MTYVDSAINKVASTCNLKLTLNNNNKKIKTIKYQTTHFYLKFEAKLLLSVADNRLNITGRDNSVTKSW